jgi:ATP-dependent RNA helicase DeaD
MKFSDFNLKETTLQAIGDLGFESATEIQEKAIPLLLENDIDFVGQAQTGTGKTAAFAIPLLEKINTRSKDVQAIILAPTRELANQIAGEIEKLSKYDPLKSLCVYGGTPIYNQIKSLSKNRPHIVVGTPGRVLDLLKRGALKLDTAKYFILDEADEMLDMGFFDDVNEILDSIENEARKIWMFSATMPKAILSLVNKHFNSPEIVKVTKKILTADSIDQKFIVVQERDMAEALARYLDYTQDIYGIVFTRTKIGAKKLSDDLNWRGYSADALHGDMVQEQRDMTMDKFKAKKVRLLICTDVAARGIDVNDLTHVINICLPQDNESYVHRIGRTGRGGSKGIALSFIPTSELRRIRDIERITKAKIEEEKLPTIDQIKEVLTQKAYANFMRSIEMFSEKNAEAFDKFYAEFSVLDKEEILKGAFQYISREFKKYNGKSELKARKERAKGGRDARGGGRDSRRSSGRDSRGPRKESTGFAQKGYDRFFLAMGRNDGMEPGKVINLISKTLNVKGSVVGRIDVKESFSFFEVPSDMKNDVLAMDKKKWNRRTINIELAKKNPSSNNQSRR